VLLLTEVNDALEPELGEEVKVLLDNKALVIDPSLSGPLGRVLDLNLLKQHGVEKTMHLRTGPLGISQCRIIYIVRANLPNMKMIAEQIRHLMQDVRRFEYRVCMFPRKTTMCERVLEEEGVFDDISLTDFDLGFIPIDDNLISLEMSDAFRELKLHQDMTNLFDAAKAIMQLQVLCGIIPVIKGKGENAKVVADMLIKLREEVGREDEVVESELTIDELILVDRELDLVTPMLTPLSYEGLIDESSCREQATSGTSGTTNKLE
ncbi:vacuolar protein sorting 33B, partial [Guillardia theta CCMP2712]